MASLTQNAAWSGELDHAGVRICAGAVVREGAVIHQGTYRETTVGARSWVLNRAYLAHDVLLGADATVSAGVSVGGHCEIGDRVNIGMNAVIHQRRVIAPGAMIGMGTPVTRDVPPFAKVYGTPPRIAGINAVGLERAGHPPDLAKGLQEYYVQGEYFVDTSLPLLGIEPLASQIDWWRSRNGKNPPKFAGHFEEKYTSSS
ncbi:acyl-ACP--UDP-N- acetylglucosamine O-acyltransferase [Leucobacter sp. NPDC015123]|uniref:acyl-ACP--UDP-N- acetylglucosamine O-acyltransferase n=1 Tax=Leucobacter sp. NPDC015123 TaxID=3364129 RepID=UPI0036F48F65